MKEKIQSITLALLCIAFGTQVYPLASAPPAPKQNIPDPALPFGPADVSVLRHVSTLAERLRFLGAETTILADGKYLCPTPDLLPSLLTTCEAMRSKFYVGSAFDCDDIAKEYCVSAAKWLVATFGRDMPGGIALGSAYVRINGPVEGFEDYPPCLHVINILMLSDGRLIFIEPATGNFVDAESSVYEGVIEVMLLVF